MKPVSVAFLWHMHQPLYRLRGERVSFMPWVRLHAIRSYYDMIRVLDEFPDIRVTMNLVPVLIDQICAYEQGGSDAFLEAASRPAEDLDDEQRIFLFDNFFSVEEVTMIRALPRFSDLLEKRRRVRRQRGTDEAWQEFSTSDYRDLQALFDLAWFGFKAREDFPEIRLLCGKGQNYTEENLREIHDIEKTILAQVLPLYRAAAAKGQIEIATSPYAHPILPLLIDSESAREAIPGMPLPPRFQAPDDAAAQVREALDRVEAEMGTRPVGMWPSEGSISQAAIERMGACGIRWAASDNDVLSASHLDGQPACCRPWRTTGPGDAVTLVFRDHDLSDRIGFSYARLDAAAAAADFVGAVLNRGEQASGDRALVLIALDGENPWEHYPQAGAPFLRALYSSLLKTPSVTSRTVSGAIADAGPPATITRLRAGSWIRADFGTWIGGPEKNRAWTVLGRVRTEVTAALRDPGISEAARGAGWASLRAAEGSDWFWWLDGQFSNAYREQFDSLFRGHLRQACEAVGRPAPEILDWPIPSIEMRTEPRALKAPEVLLTPRIDGFENDFFEWQGAVAIRWDGLDPRSSMQRAQRPFEALRFGFTPDFGLVLRIDPGVAVGPAILSGIAADFSFRVGETHRQVSVELDERGDLRQAHRSDAENPQQAVGCEPIVSRPSAARAAARKVLEISLPLEETGLEPGGEGIMVLRVRTATGTLLLREIVLIVPGPPLLAAVQKAS